MARSLPPLAAIRVFEAAARHKNFTRAAAELGMTQASVSYQIKVLEERVGAPLFVRRPRDVVLTDAGRALAPAASEALDGLAAAFAAARGATEGVLTIGVQFTFANWLAARIGAFQIAHPSLAVRMVTVQTFADTARDNLDVSIYWGKGEWTGCIQALLAPALFTAMMSPALLAQAGTLAQPSDILRLRLIDPGDPWWNLWFEAAGVARPAPMPAQSPVRFGSQHLEGRATLAGHGVGILSPFIFAEELVAGRLVQPFDLVCDDGKGYWLAYAEGRRLVPKIRAFRDWILAEIAGSAAQPAEPKVLG